MVEVPPPATLKAGYVFRASYEGTIFDVLVPTGGVVEGQSLVVPFDPNATTHGTAEVVGYWKSDICACTRYGLCHPSFINACCIPLVLLGQVMTRLKLDWKATPAPAGEWSKTFQIMVYITIIYTVLTLLLSPASPDDQPNALYSLISFSYGVFMLVILTRARKIVRQQNEIPESSCIGCEDFCCAFWCGCCTVSQLARQTADYDREDARFFTNDGLAPKESAPAIIV
mmetsp:Transcript_1883/g.2736  ORF Transcript_1883/g.2736 Transcript_1883/m.2736 type:complete len:228 (+) Transcript_1883:2-685(+)